MKTRANQTYQAVVAAPGVCLGVQCDNDEITVIDFLEPRPEVAATTPLAAEAVRQLKAYIADPNFRFGLPLRPAEDQRMHVVRPLVGVHHFQIDDVADDAELVRNAVAAQHVTRRAGDVERLAAGVAFHDRGDFRRRRAVVLHASEARQPCSPSVISVCMSASFFWINWLAASGRPNCLRSSVYWRAVCQQNSAAPSAPQAMP